MTQILKDDELTEFINKNPCLSMAATGRHFGKSRELIRQKVRKLKLDVPKGHRTKWYICTYCNKTFPNSYRRMFCSPECRHLYYNIPVSCEVCGTITYRQKSKVIFTYGKRMYQHAFCSKHCQGIWLGKHHHVSGVNYTIFQCKACGNTFQRPDSYVNYAQKRKQNISCCSNACRMKYMHRIRKELRCQAKGISETMPVKAK